MHHNTTLMTLIIDRRTAERTMSRNIEMVSHMIIANQLSATQKEEEETKFVLFLSFDFHYY